MVWPLWSFDWAVIEELRACCSVVRLLSHLQLNCACMPQTHTMGKSPRQQRYDVIRLRGRTWGCSLSWGDAAQEKWQSRRNPCSQDQLKLSAYAFGIRLNRRTGTAKCTRHQPWLLYTSKVLTRGPAFSVRVREATLVCSVLLYTHSS